MVINKQNGIITAVTEIPAGVGKIEVKSADGKQVEFIFDEGDGAISKYGMMCDSVVDGKMALRLAEDESDESYQLAKHCLGENLARASQYELQAASIAADRVAEQAILKATVDELFA